jgi:DNA-binding LacI/PurR family transcriptional regulator
MACPRRIGADPLTAPSGRGAGATRIQSRSATGRALQNGGVTRVTLQTIADELGVSRMTVSNAFSRPDQLSAELRDRVLATATRLGYSGPDPAARALARGSVGTIGLVFTDHLHYAFTDEVATRFLGAISEELAESGRGLTLLGSKAHGDLVPTRDIPLDGALVYACGATSEAVGWLRRRGLPLVFVDQRPLKGYPCINVDDRGGARAAAQHLVDLGHRRIAVITRLADESGVADLGTLGNAPYTTQQRMAGWSDALEPAGVVPFVVNAQDSTEIAGYAAAGFILSLPVEQRPTAVLTYSDRIALGAVQAARDLGLEVPIDLSVVGFDDAAFAATSRPPLTTVRQDVARKGHEATAMLSAAIERRVPQRTDHRLMPTELVVRASTAPVR